MPLKGLEMCGACQKKGSASCFVTSTVAKFLRGGGGKSPYPHACESCHKSRGKCELPGISREKKVRKAKSKANIEGSEDGGLETSSDGESVDSLETELRKMDSSLVKVQGAVETLAVKVVSLDSGQAQDNRWTQDRILEIQQEQRKQGDMLTAILGSLPGGSGKLEELEAKWKQEAAEAEEKMRKRVAKEKKKAEMSDKKKGKLREDSEVASGSMDLEA